MTQQPKGIPAGTKRLFNVRGIITSNGFHLQDHCGFDGCLLDGCVCIGFRAPADFDYNAVYDTQTGLRIVDEGKGGVE